MWETGARWETLSRFSRSMQGFNHKRKAGEVGEAGGLRRRAKEARCSLECVRKS